MSSWILVWVSMAAVAAFVIGVVLHFLRRWLLPKRSRWWEVAIPLILMAAAVLWVAWDRAMPAQGMHTTPQAANEVLTRFQVPTAATAVDYRHARFRDTIDEANFTISEADFLSWMKSKGWPARKFYTDEKGFHWTEPVDDPWERNHVTVTPITAREEDDEIIEIKNGYEFIWQVGDHLVRAFVVVYDRDTQRAYVRAGIYAGRQ